MVGVLGDLAQLYVCPEDHVFAPASELGHCCPACGSAEVYPLGKWLRPLGVAVNTQTPWQRVGLSGAGIKARNMSPESEMSSRASALLSIRHALWLSVALLALSGCVTQSASIVPEAATAPTHRTVQVRPCQDRSGFTGRDLGAETTRALTEKVRASGVFDVREDAPLALTCDIERFEEGSALKRWVWPTWGTTVGQVAVSVWEQPGDRVLATFRAETSVSVGGLYTIGADQYVLGVAVDDIVGQMKAWASGPASPR